MFEPEAPAEQRCSVCHRQAEPESLARCFLCGHTACEWCWVRRGSQTFCGSKCASVDYFMGMDDWDEGRYDE